MGLILELSTGVLLVACAVMTLWTAGAIYFDMCGGAKWGRWVALGWVVGVTVAVRGLAAALAAVRCLARGRVAIPRLVVPAEAEPRPRLGS